MAEKNDSNEDVVRVQQIYQPKAERTYSPVMQSGNYQPLIPTAAGSNAPTPPVGVSGVLPAKNGGDGGVAPSAKNSSS
jgi:hypothetical protein